MKKWKLVWQKRYVYLLNTTNRILAGCLETCTVKSLITHTFWWTVQAMGFQRLWVGGGRKKIRTWKSWWKFWENPIFFVTILRSAEPEGKHPGSLCHFLSAESRQNGPQIRYLRILKSDQGLTGYVGQSLGRTFVFSQGQTHRQECGKLLVVARG